MDILPNEILLLIFDGLKGLNLLRCTDVCRRWNYIIREGIGIYKNIGTKPIFLEKIPINTKFQEIDIIQQVGLNRCILSNIGDQNVPNFRNPFLLKSLALYCTISRKNFNQLLTPLENLRILWLHLTVLNQFKMNDDSVCLNFPKLKQFSITDDGNDGISPDFFLQLPNHELLLENLASILSESKFPKLEQANMVIPNEFSLFKPIITFLTNHQNTLRSIFLDVNIDLNVKPGQNQQVILPPKFEVPNVQLIGFYIMSNINNGHLASLFNPIIQFQTGLRHYVNHASTTSFTKELVLQNSRSLVTLETYIDGRGSQVLDLGMFENCTSLKSLVLRGRSPGGQKAEIVNTKCLPKSLQRIIIINIKINNNDASELITKESDRLIILELYHIGTTDGFGVPFPALCQLLATKRIKYVRLLGSISFESVEHVQNYVGERDFLSPEAVELQSLLREELYAQFYLDKSQNSQKYVFNDFDTIDIYSEVHLGRVYEEFKIVSNPNNQHSVKCTIVYLTSF